MVERAVLHHQHDDVIDVREQARVGQRRVRAAPSSPCVSTGPCGAIAGERQRDAPAPTGA